MASMADDDDLDLNYENLITKEYMASKFVNFQNVIIVFANISNIRSVVIELIDTNSDSGDFVKQMGVSNLILLLSFNKYLYMSKDYGIFPKTLVKASRTVLEGLIGVLPLIVGLMFMAKVIFFESYLFKSLSDTGFTFFFTTNGDFFGGVFWATEKF